MQFLNQLTSKILWAILIVALLVGGYVFLVRTLVKPPQIASTNTPQPINPNPTPTPNTNPNDFNPSLVDNSSATESNSNDPVYEEDLLPAIAQAEDVVISVPQKLERGGILKMYINNDGNKYPDPILYSPSKILKTDGLSPLGNDNKEVFQEVSGYFLVPEDGSYNFTIDFPSNWYIKETRHIRAKIDGVLLPTVRGGRLSLEKGWHKINLFLYAYNIDGNLLKVSWGQMGEESKPIKVWREVKEQALSPTPTPNNQPEILNTAQPTPVPVSK